MGESWLSIGVTAFSLLVHCRSLLFIHIKQSPYWLFSYFVFWKSVFLLALPHITEKRLLFGSHCNWLLIMVITKIILLMVKYCHWLLVRHHPPIIPFAIGDSSSIMTSPSLSPSLQRSATTHLISGMSPLLTHLKLLHSLQAREAWGTLI